MTSAWHYDGESALRQAVTLSAHDGLLQITDTNGQTISVSAGVLTFVEDRGHEIVYGRSDRQGWRLGLAKPPPDAIASMLPSAARYGRWIDRIGIVRASVIGVAVSAAIMFAVYSLPHWLAPIIPDSWMKRYGDAMVGDFGGKFCAGPGGQAALDRLVRQLAPAAKNLNVRVVNIPIVNAAALPGGNIVVFEELLSEASSAEEFAGVLAHEIAHVENRDVAEAMVRELGLGLVISSIGGNVGGQIHQLAALSYSRDAETDADTASIRAMLRTGISPAPTAKFFERLAKDESVLGNAPEVLAYLSTHPVSKDRAAAFRNAAKGRSFTPALSRDEWVALVNICHNDLQQNDWLGGEGGDDKQADFKTRR